MPACPSFTVLQKLKITSPLWFAIWFCYLIKVYKTNYSLIKKKNHGLDSASVGKVFAAQTRTWVWIPDPRAGGRDKRTGAHWPIWWKEKLQVQQNPKVETPLKDHHHNLSLTGTHTGTCTWNTVTHRQTSYTQRQTDRRRDRERDGTEIAQTKLSQNNSEALRYMGMHEFHYRRQSYKYTQSSL